MGFEQFDDDLRYIEEQELETSVFDDYDRDHADWLIDPDMGDQ